MDFAYVAVGVIFVYLVIESDDVFIALDGKRTPIRLLSVTRVCALGNVYFESVALSVLGRAKTG